MRLSGEVPECLAPICPPVRQKIGQEDVGPFGCSFALLCMHTSSHATHRMVSCATPPDAKPQAESGLALSARPSRRPRSPVLGPRQGDSLPQPPSLRAPGVLFIGLAVADPEMDVNRSQPLAHTPLTCTHSLLTSCRAITTPRAIAGLGIALLG